ncbi:hypothetical protein JAO73_02730 [Hymenobacter sp. BT523]|uniref:hypothetical protein n=1 Tax=Hymenobacter sp. BT523 TaxID=2795725 RepID=UPI0018EC6102|nr:hypothetical protein [Hymenobacter sp. BT523]MBJ6107911.1 hypothetical protein [Hymenobacter sp. BT523]
MPITLLSTSEALDLYHDEENNWLYLDWKGALELANVQEDCQRILTYISQLGTLKALNDNSHITHISWELLKWVAEVYLPATARAGMACVAWVHSQALECRSDVELLLPVADNCPPQLSMFDDVAAAYAWLRSVRLPAAPVGQQ